MGAESLSRRRIAVIASGRDSKHFSLRELNPVKVRVEATSASKQHMLTYSYTPAGSCRGAGAISEEPHSFREVAACLP
jgi:hypothetical protein